MRTVRGQSGFSRNLKSAARFSENRAGVDFLTVQAVIT